MNDRQASAVMSIGGYPSITVLDVIVDNLFGEALYPTPRRHRRGTGRASGRREHDAEEP
jgi:hypothetical protein